MMIFIENADQSVRFSRPFIDKNLEDYWKIEENKKYFVFMEELEKKFNVTLNFYGEGDEVGYIIEEDKDKDIIEKIFQYFSFYIEQNI
jgi:hypothetical protein